MVISHEQNKAWSKETGPSREPSIFSKPLLAHEAPCGYYDVPAWHKLLSINHLALGLGITKLNFSNITSD